MEQESVPINDLYALMLSSKSYYKCPDMLHLTEEGYNLCAEQAASIIRKEINK
jgi:lysophospholipase L1-like esterase